jgi:hypothetical protein
MDTRIKIDNKEVLLSEVVCSCFNVTIEDCIREISKNKSISYDEFLSITNATNKCTACSLDVEYYFTKIQNTDFLLKIEKKSFFKKNLKNKSIKQEIYKIVDRITPMVSMMQTNYIPIVGTSKELESWIWISNYSMMYEKSIFGARMDIELIVRDNLGYVKYKKKYFLDRESRLRVNVSQFLLADNNLDNGEILVGSLEIKRTPLEVGVRGTTRPHLEVLAKKGNGTVHTQGDSRREFGGFSCLYRPDTDITLIAVTNTDVNNKNNFYIEYPVGETLNFSGDLVKERIPIDPKATILYRIKLSDTYIGRLIHIKWRFTSSRSVYVFCASNDLSQISIDHVT